MSTPAFSLLLALCGIFVLRIALKLVRARQIRKLMPPGPPGIPLLRNALQMPQEQAFRQFTEWAKVYGPIFSLNLAGKPVVVINTLKVANDLLDRRSAIYSDRPRLIVPGEIMTGGLDLAFMPYGQKWRKQRRAVQEAFNDREARAYRTLQEKEAARLSLRLLDEPDSWARHFERSTASTVVSIVYGSALAAKSLDTIVERVDHLIRTASRAAGKDTHLVELFPSMLYLPSWLAKWKRDGEAMFREYSILFEGYMEEVKIQIENGNNEPSFCGHVIKNQEKYGLEASEAAWLSGVMIAAGTDTTAGMLSVFLLSMVLHPEAMQRAQAELDTVVGRERLPTFEDQASLPYVNAVVKEMLRWRTVAPLGIPRRSRQDDWYGGYLIPEGTILIENIWAMAHNSADFPDPESFLPERFLNRDASSPDFAFDTKVRKHFTFGFGRRVCPGMNIAFQALFIDVARMLWALDLRPLNNDNVPCLPSRDACVDDGGLYRSYVVCGPGFKV